MVNKLTGRRSGRPRRLASAVAMLGTLFLLSTCDNVFQVGLGDKVDIEPPTITIDSHGDGQYLSGPVTFTGTVGDDLSVQTVGVSIDGGETFDPVTYTPDGSTWSHAIDTSQRPDAEYEVRVRVTDGAGKTADAKVLVYFDNTAPTVLVRTPQGLTVDESRFNKTISVSGDAYDRFGVADVSLSLTWLSENGVSVGEQELVLRRTADEVAAASGADAADSADGTNSWSYTFDSTLYTNDPDSTYEFQFTVTATDPAGNSNTAVFLGDELREKLGLTPSVNELYSALQTSSKSIRAASGTNVSVAPLMKDAFSLDVIQNIDLPVIEFAVPSEASSADTPETLAEGPVARGSVSDDDGIDLGSLEYVLVSDWESATWDPVVPTDPPGGWVPISDKSGSGGRVNWTLDLQEVLSVGDLQGRHAIAIRVTDTEGERRVSDLIPFVIDFETPTLTETASGIAGSSFVYLNGPVTFGGTASDTNELELLEVRYSKNGEAPQTLFSGLPAVDKTWSVPFAPDADGPDDSLGTADDREDAAYEITIVASDASSSSSITRNIVFDTAAPTVEITSPVDGEFVDDSADAIRGTAEDGSGRGVVALDYSFDYTADGDDTNDTWLPVSQPGFSWQSTGVDFAGGGEGSKTLFVRASDGINPAVIKSVAFSYDLAPPELVEDEIGTDAQQITGADVVFSGTVVDTNGLSELEIAAEQDGVDRGVLFSTSTAGAWSYSQDLPGDGSADGDWVYTLTATDVAGRTTTLTRRVLIDATAPSTPTIEDFPGEYAVNELVVSGGTSDAGSGVETVEYSLDYTDDGDDGNDTWLVANGTESWYRTIDISVDGGGPGADLAEGSHTLSVRATDRAGNQSDVESQPFVVDRAHPVLSIPGFEATQYRNADFTIAGTVTDTLALPAAPVTVVVDGPSGPVDLSSFPVAYDADGPDDTLGTADDGAFSQVVPVDDGDGEYTVTVSASDAAGRTTVSELAAIRDTAPPTVTVGNLTDGARIEKLALTVLGTAGDDVSPLDSVEYSLNDGPWTEAIGTASWSAPLDSVLVEGTDQSISFRATDGAGNTSLPLSVGFDVDAAAPVLDETSSGIPGTSIVYRNADVQLGGPATDGNGVESVVVEYIKDGGAPVVLLDDRDDDGSWSTTLPIGAEDAGYEITITATDRSGRSTSMVRNVVIDTAAPDLSIGAPVAGESVAGAAYDISGQVTDNGGKGVVSLAYSLTGAFAGEEIDIPLAGLNWSLDDVDFSVGGEGAKTLYVQASDGLNPATEVSVGFSYDLAPPVLDENQIGTDAQQITGSDVIFSGTVSDTNGLFSLEISAQQDGVGRGVLFTTATAGAWSYTQVLPGDGSADGEWVYTLTATDVAGRTTTLTRRVLIDATAPPAPTIDAFLGDYAVNELVASGSAADGGSGVQTVEYSFDESAWATVYGTESWYRTIDISVDGGGPGADLAEGSHTLSVRATDRAGNVSAIATGPFTVDRANPTIAVDASYDGTVYRSADFTITGMVADSLGLDANPVTIAVDREGSPVALPALSYDADGLDDTPGTAADGAWSQEVPIGDGDGDYSVTITATDAVGRPTTATRTVVADTTPPAFTIANVAADGSTQVNGPAYTVSGTASDGSSGVSLVEYSLDYTDDGNDANDTWVAATGAASWTAALGGLSDGLDRTFAVRATDGAGNTSPVTDRRFDVDLSDPLLAITGGNTVPGLGYLNTDMVLSGTSSDANGVSSVTVAYSKDGTPVGAILDDTDDNGIWSVTLAEDGTDDGEYEFTVTATDAVGKTTSLTRTIILDTVDPSAEYTSVSPLVGTNTVNGTISVRATVTDNIGLDQVRWALLPDGSTPTSGDYTVVTGSRTAPEFQIDTTVGTGNVVVNGSSPYDATLADGQTTNLWIEATDRSGNRFEAAQPLAVDQSSDIPTIAFTTLDDSATSSGDAFKNLIESNALVRFTITDDDLVDASTIEISIGDDSSWQPINYNAGSPPTDGKTVNTNHNLYLPSMLSEGTTLFYLRASDEASAKSGLGAIATEMGPIYVMVDRNFPTVSETNRGADGFASALFTLSGSVGDTNALKNLTITESVDGGTPVEVLNTNLSGTVDTWTLADMPSSGTPADGEYAYTITVTDQSDKQTVATRIVTIDTTDPQVPTVSTPTTDAWLNSGTFVFQGAAADGSGSGVETVYYSEFPRGTGAPAKGDPAWQEATVDGSGNWSATVSIGAPGERELHVYSVDAAGNDSGIGTHNFGLDQAVPAVTVVGGSSTLSVNSDFQIAGSFTDASGLADVTVESSTDNVAFSVADPATAVIDTGAGTWSWDRTLGGQGDGTYYYRFSFTDNAGNATQLTKVVNLDTSAPVVTFDTASPSINFDGGAMSATANGVMALSGSISEDQGVGNIETVEYQVDGGGYASLPVNGSFTVSGIDTTVYPDPSTIDVDVRVSDANGNQTTESFTFAIDQSTDDPVVTIDSPVNAETVTATTVTVSGSITDDDGITGDPGTVQYRFSETGLSADFGPWQDVSVGGTPTSRTFSYALTASSDGAKLLRMRSFDEGGIASASVEIALTFDTDEPEILSLAPATGAYFNSDFVLSGTATDDSGDVTLLRYRVERDGAEITPWTAVGGTPAPSVPFSETIDTSTGGGVYDVFLEASDGTRTRSRTISVTVDKTSPELFFTAPSPGSVQNNIISITGTTSDMNELVIGEVDSVSFAVLNAGAGNAEETLPTGTLGGTNLWQISDLDTRNATLLSYGVNDPDSDGTTTLYEITLRGTVTDRAGNSTSEDLVFRIDQTADRPVVSFEEIATDGSSTITSATIRGTVTDDDGVDQIIVDTFRVGNSGPIPDDSETVTLTSGSYGDTDLNWRVLLSDVGNGLRGIRVRAIDTADNNGGDYSAGDWSRVETARIDFELDTENPDVAIDTPLANITWSANDSFTVTGTAGDETGITQLSYKVDDNDFSSGATAVPDTNGDGWSTWTFTVPQGDLADGPHTIYVQATDSVGNTRSAQRQLVVDKTAPTITITSPSAGSAVFGPLTIGGTAADLGAGASGVLSVSVGLGKQIDEGDLAGSTWTSVVGTTNWSFSFLNINDFANTTYSFNTGDTDRDGIEDVGETWTDLWDFTFYVRAIDEAGDSANGNTAYLTSYTLQIDPKRDRPEVTILSPIPDAQGDTVVGGFLRVFGSAFDSQFIEMVQIAIDSDNDGDYTNDTWSEGTLADTDPDGTNWYLADGTTSWSVRLNENGEFDPQGADTTRTISFKVRARDYKVDDGGPLLGDGIYGAEVEYTDLTFNKDFPQFDGISLTSGETVGGTVTLTGIVRDETDIRRIIFSNEGPLLDNNEIFDNPGGLLPPGSATTTVATTPNPYGGSDITVDLIGTSDPDYDSAFPGSYRVSIPIDTTAPGLYAGGAGSMSVKVTAEDVTTPSPFTNQSLISFSVDNVQPSDLTYTGDSEILGTEAELQGTVRDTGTVSGIERIVVYLTDASGNLVRLNGGGTMAMPLLETLLTDDPEDNTETLDDYRMVIDNRLEEGNDGGAAGDNDGISEFLTLSGGTYNWAGRFDSIPVADGAVTVHYVAEDFAGNRASGSNAAFIANNKPSIDSIVLGTDLNGDGDVLDVGEQTIPITAGYEATGYTARNGVVYVDVLATGGNTGITGNLHYVVTYDSNDDGTFDTTIDAGTTNSTFTIDTSNGTLFPDGPATFHVLVFDETTAPAATNSDDLTASVEIGLTIDNVDEVAPTISLQHLASDDVAFDSFLTPIGHIEPWDQSPFDNRDAGFDKTAEVYGNDADVSGTVILTGTAFDDQRIQNIVLWLDLDGDATVDVGEEQLVGEFESVSAAMQPVANPLGSFSVDNESLDSDTGHSIEWSFEWDTAATVNGVARTNVRIGVSALDYGTNTAAEVPGGVLTADTSLAGGFNVLSVDVVPYLRDVIGELENGTRRFLRRTARGGFPARTGQTLTLEGFNIHGASPAVNIAGVIGAATTDPTTGTHSLEFTIDGAAASGSLELTNNGIGSLNNVNDNRLPSNGEAADYRPDQTDDRYLHIWDINTRSTIDGRTEAVMRPNAAGNGYDWMTAENAQTVRINGQRLSHSWTIRGGWFDRNDDGTLMYIYLHDMNWFSGRDSYEYHGSVQFGMGDVDQGAAYNWQNTDTNRLGVGNLSFNSDPNWDGTPNYEGKVMSRYENLQVDVSGTDAETDVFVTYFDKAAESRSIVFYSFKVGENLPAGEQVTQMANGFWSSLTKQSPRTGNYPAADYRVGLRTPTSRIELTAGGADSNQYDFHYDGTTAYVVYYDESSSELKLITNGDPVGTPGSWSAPVVLDVGGGLYPDIEVDPDGGVHVSYYDTTQSNLKYLYLATLGATPSPVVVDALFTTGWHTSMDIRDFGAGDYRPVITHYSISFAGTNYALRVSYPTSSANRLINGANVATGDYTGSWEMIPVMSVTPAADVQTFTFIEGSGAVAVGYNGTVAEEATLTGFGNP